tara:strand:+ start:6956 stop:7123 length:168 start_codon:yes stop_codon:yes gene_type:complete
MTGSLRPITVQQLNDFATGGNLGLELRVCLGIGAGHIKDHIIKHQLRPIQADLTQ